MKEELIARNSLWKLPLLLMVSVFFVLVAVLNPQYFGLTPKPGWELMRWPVALIFGFAAIYVARQLFDRKPQVVVSRSGIFMRQWSPATIPWEAFRSIRVERQYFRAFMFKRHLCLYLHDPEAYPRTTWRRRVFPQGSNLGFGDITMMTTGLDHEIEDLWEAIERFAPPEIALDGSQLGGRESVGPRRKRG